MRAGAAYCTLQASCDCSEKEVTPVNGLPPFQVRGNTIELVWEVRIRFV